MITTSVLVLRRYPRAYPEHCASIPGHWILETADEKGRPPAVFDSLELALDATGGQGRAHHPPVHILLAGQARAHQAVEGCNQHFQEAASMSRHGQERGPMSGVRHRPRKATGVRRNRRSQQHAVAGISGGESERQD